MKRYYIQLKTNLLTSKKVDYLFQKGGSDYPFIYQILSLLSINTNGKLGTQIGDTFMAYDTKWIASHTNGWFSSDTIKSAINEFQKIGLLEIENDVMILKDFEELVGKQEVCERKNRPELEEVVMYCEERKNGIDPQAFFDYYEARNWEIKRQPIKDWKACVRTWEIRDKKKPEQTTSEWFDDYWKKIKEDEKSKQK